MTTPSPDKQESLEEIARRIRMRFRGRIIPPEREDDLERDVLAALQNERERAAKILDVSAMLANPAGVIPANDPEHERLQGVATVLSKAATAIREGR